MQSKQMLAVASNAQNPNSLDSHGQANNLPPVLT